MIIFYTQHIEEIVDAFDVFEKRIENKMVKTTRPKILPKENAYGIQATF